jgi:Domain of unknown function (DUF4279)
MGDISRTQVNFRIGADVFQFVGALPDVTAVTIALGIEPTRAFSAGERYRPRSPVPKNGMWSLESPLPEDTILETHLRWLLGRLLPARERILTVLDSDPRLSADFFCGLWLNEVNEGLELTAATLSDIGSLHASLGLDIYGDGDDEG